MKEWESIEKRAKGNLVGFTSYVEELTNMNVIEDETALGIAKYLLDKGAESLSPAQWYTLINNGIIDYYASECLRCAEDIPWEEMYHATYYDEDSLCSYCRHISRKD